MNRLVVPAQAVVALAVAACGSASHHAASSNAAHTGGASTTSTPAVTGTTAYPSAQRPAGATATSTGPGQGTPGASGSAPAGGQEKIRLPANFTITRGGSLSPSSVSSPSFLALELTVASADGRAHRILVRTPTPHSLSVPAGAKASTLVPGLPPGHYAVSVDGAVRGMIAIGGEPGP